MKLNATQLAAVKQQTGADPIEDGSDAHGQLSEAFGDHTFYVSEVGLLVPESVEAEGADPLELILVAQWTDDKREAMERIPPQQTGYVLDAGAEGGAANG